MKLTGAAILASRGMKVLPAAAELVVRRKCTDPLQAMRYTVANTAKGPIEYRLEGSGPVVIVLNGGHCSRDTRLSHERLAGCGFSVLTPSRPGYDETPADVGRSAQEAADALAALLEQLQIARASVIGISAAGPTALAFAQQYPDRVDKLVWSRQ